MSYLNDFQRKLENVLKVGIFITTDSFVILYSFNENSNSSFRVNLKNQVFMSLNHVSSNSSKSPNHGNIARTGTDHYNSKLSKKNSV